MYLLLTLFILLPCMIPGIGIKKKAGPGEKTSGHVKSLPLTHRTRHGMKERGLGVKGWLTQ